MGNKELSKLEVIRRGEELYNDIRRHVKGDPEIEKNDFDMYALVTFVDSLRDKVNNMRNSVSTARVAMCEANLTHVNIDPYEVRDWLRVIEEAGIL